jgi:DNA invertase Pin-like site-specific DNA recombinase
MPAKPARPVRVAIYSRVSTDHQTTENQERELHAIADRMGWTVAKVYRDQGVSGAKARESRPAFDALCKDASRRQFDLIAAWSVDRLGRSLQDLIGFLTEIHALGINLFLHQQGIDTTTPAGKALFQMMGVFAEFERAMIQERVKAGLERAKAQGKVLGRKRINATKEAAILADLRSGKAGIIKLAGLHGVGVGTVQRIKTAMTG